MDHLEGVLEALDHLEGVLEELGLLEEVLDHLAEEGDLDLTLLALIFPIWDSLEGLDVAIQGDLVEEGLDSCES